MFVNPTDPNKRKQSRKFDTKTLIPKSRQAKTNWQKLIACFL